MDTFKQYVFLKYGFKDILEQNTEVLNKCDKFKKSLISDFYDLIKADHYLIKYFFFMDWLLPVEELIDIIREEDITVYYLKRDSIDVIVSYVIALRCGWTEQSVTVEQANALTISDKELAEILEHMRHTESIYNKMLAANVVKQELSYEELDFNNPTSIVKSLFNENIPISAESLRNTVLSADVRKIIINNNELIERVQHINTP
jgi:hypothetical protein